VYQLEIRYRDKLVIENKESLNKLTIITGKYPLSQRPTRKRIAYSCEAFPTEEEQNVKTDHKISNVGIRIDGRTRVANMTAGSCPITYPAVKTLPAYVSSLPCIFSASFIWKELAGFTR
jgi:hypothetical protein